MKHPVLCAAVFVNLSARQYATSRSPCYIYDMQYIYDCATLELSKTITAAVSIH
jgi:hypothetical protein